MFAITGGEDVQDVLKRLHESAARTLPEGTVYDIRVNLTRDGIAWYHVEAMRDWPVADQLESFPGKINPLGGYFSMGVCRTPDTTGENSHMPWTSKDSKRHTKKANTAKKQRQWSHVSNDALERGASEGSAIRQANSVVARNKRK